MKTLSDIAAELQGYDPNALSVSAALAFVRALVTALGDSAADIEAVPVFDALGRTLAQDVISPIDVPPHDNSAMDGFAFRGAELDHPDTPDDSPPLRLRIVGTAFAGQAWRGAVGAGECVKIMTGAVMPDGLDTVVPQEMTKVSHDVVHLPRRAIQPGDNRRLRGEDLRRGEAAVRRGAHVNAATLGLIASLGKPTVQVFRRLRVAYFSTGDEILTLGEAHREGAVYDSNRYTVFGLLRGLGCEVIDLGVVPDDPVRLRAAFTQAAAQADAVITSGGVSVGEADHTKAMIRQLGDVAFWRIAMRPGRPMAVGRLTSAESPHSPRLDSISSYQKRSALLFGLPGNPVAVMVTFLAFVRPALLQMMGRSQVDTPLLPATSATAIRKKPGRTEYQRGIVSRNAHGQWIATTLGNQGSGVLSSMVNGNALIVLHHDQGDVAAGDAVEVLLLDGLI